MTTLKHFFSKGLCIGVLALFSATSSWAAENLLVYTAIEPEYLNVYKEAFEKNHPDIKITYVRASAGPISARLIAEKDHPQADVVLGLSAIALENLRQKGILEPYRPKGYQDINPKMHSPEFHWFGMNAWGGSICVNTDLLKNRGLPIPQSWKDLTNPIYKGQIVMPSPLASSTGYMFFLGWIQGFGENEGWDYYQKLHENMLFYTSSGARPAAMVAQGEIPIGLSSDAFMKPFLKYNIPVTTVEPVEGIAWDAEGSALPKGSPHPELAKKFLDFCASKDVALIAADFSGIAAINRYSTPKGQSISSRFLPLDFERAALEKSSIVKRWQEYVQK